MARACFIRVWTAAGVLVAALSLAGTAAGQEVISEEAKLYFRNGVELIQSSPPNYQDAYYQFKLAYEKSKSWKVLGNLGLCALKLERDGEALDAYTEYLEAGGDEVDPEERKALERETLLINGNSAVVNLESAIADIELIDSRAGTAVPAQSYKFPGQSMTLRLRAGTHTLTATAPDGRQERFEVVLSPGKTAQHRFEFAAPDPASPAAPAAPPPTAPADQGVSEGGGSGLKTVGFVALGVGGAALIGGVVTGLMAKGKETDATDQCTDNNACPTAAESDFDSAASLATVTNVLLIGGGVLAATGVGLVVFGGSGGGEQAPAAARAPTLRLVPVAAGEGGGLFAHGTF